MGTLLSRILSPAPLLYTLVVVTQFAEGAYLGAQVQFPEGVRFILTIGFLLAVGWWVLTDSRRRGSFCLRSGFLSLSRVAGSDALLSLQNSGSQGAAYYPGVCRGVHRRGPRGNGAFCFGDFATPVISPTMSHKFLFRAIKE